MLEIDDADARILNALQADGSLTVNSLAEAVNLSTNACWRRLKRLEESGAIRKRVVLVDPDILGMKMTAFVNLRAKNHSEEWMMSLIDAVKSIENVVEFYRIAGEIDYLLKLKLRDISDYDAVYRKLISKVDIAQITASFSMEEIIYTTSIPLKATK
jgi:Lrp/AsnC family transcriptional regulator